MNPPDIIESRGLVFKYTRYDDANDQTVDFTALRDIDVNIERGEFISIVGHNGSGKSTLAKHMNALLLPTSGTIWVGGFDTSETDNTWRVRQTAGMVFQNPDNQIIATIVEEDIAFGPENLGIEPSLIRERVDWALGAVRMDGHQRSTPHTLSGGQKQRIAIAGVLAMKPDCIVLDEPTAMLDPLGRKEVLETVAQLNRDEGITIILITHFMEEAAKAGRVIVMEDGKIAMDGPPGQVFSNVGRMREIGLDVPQATELAYYLRENGVNIRGDILEMDEMADEICTLLR